MKNTDGKNGITVEYITHEARPRMVGARYTDSGGYRATAWYDRKMIEEMIANAERDLTRWQTMLAEWDLVYGETAVNGIGLVDESGVLCAACVEEMQ